MLKLYAGRDIARMLPAESVCGTFSVHSNKPAPFGLDALPDLDVTACINEAGSLITVFIVNRSLREVKTELKLRGFEPSEETLLYEITGDSIDEINNVFAPNRISCKASPVPTSALFSGYPLRPSSVYAIEIKAALKTEGQLAGEKNDNQSV